MSDEELDIVPELWLNCLTSYVVWVAWRWQICQPFTLQYNSLQSTPILYPCQTRLTAKSLFQQLGRAHAELQRCGPPVADLGAGARGPWPPPLVKPTPLFGSLIFKIPFMSRFLPFWGVKMGAKKLFWPQIGTTKLRYGGQNPNVCSVINFRGLNGGHGGQNDPVYWLRLPPMRNPGSAPAHY